MSQDIFHTYRGPILRDARISGGGRGKLRGGAAGILSQAPNDKAGLILPARKRPLRLLK